MKYLHSFYLDFDKSADSCFSTIVDGKQTNKIPSIHAGETSRGIRVVLKGIRYDEEIQCVAYFKIPNKIEPVRVVPFNRKNNIFDIYFPIMDEGQYECEILAFKKDKVLSSGVFKGDCTKTIREDAYENYVIPRGIEDILNEYDKYSLLYKKGVKELEKLTQEAKKIKMLEETLNKKIDELDVSIQSNDKTFIFTQIQSKKEWIVEHNLNKFPSITVVDTGGNRVFGEENHVNKNKVKLNFSHPFSGVAYLN